MKQLLLDPNVQGKSEYQGNFAWYIIEKAGIGSVLRFDQRAFVVNGLGAFPVRFKEVSIDSGAVTLIVGEGDEPFPGGSGGAAPGLTQLDSTVAPLGAGATYAGAAFDASPFAALCAVVFADQAGNAFIDQSVDGQNWDINDTVAVVAGVGNRIRAVRVATFCRLRYVNGGVLQTAFRAKLSGSTT
jgi:hypothetical protein